MRHLLAFLFSFSAIALSAQLPYTQIGYTNSSQTDIIYGTAIDYAGGTDTLTMDIYKPVGDNNCLRPLMILVHGGAWIGGSKNDASMVYTAQLFAQCGWVVASIKYRLGMHQTSNYNMYTFCNNSISAPCAYICDSSEIYRANYRGMQDAKGAIRFMKSRHLLDSTDINNVFIVGESAGGFIGLAAAFTDQANEKPANCFAIANAPTPSPNLAPYGCNPANPSLSRPDLGSIDGTLNIGLYDATVKGVGSFYGAILNLNIVQQQSYTPAVYLFHQGSDVVVNYGFGPLLGRISNECFAPFNLCQQYYFTPYAHGSESIRQYFVSLGSGAPIYQADIIYNYNYTNDCSANGHSVDNAALRLQNMVNLFAPIIAGYGNNPATNCQNVGINESTSSFFNLYPNPTENQFTIQFQRNMTNPIIRIYSTVGQLVYEEKNVGSFQTIALHPQLAAGSYVVELQANGLKQNQLLIVK